MDANDTLGYAAEGDIHGTLSDINVVPLDMSNISSPGAVDATPCTNEYCVSDEDYIDMIMDYIYPTAFEWVLIALYGIVFIIGLIGNFLVCFVVFKNQSMRTVTNYFIVNLSVADLMVILICLPPTVLDDVTETWYIGSVMCKIVKYLQSVSVSVSVFTLSAISVERFFAICFPLSFKATTRRTRFIIVGIWVVSLAILIPELVVLDTQQKIPKHLDVKLLTACKPLGWAYTIQSGYQLFLAVALFFIPLCLMASAYSAIAVCLWKTKVPSETGSYTCSKPLHHGEKSSDQALLRQLIYRRKVAKMLIAVVVMFAVCYLPVHLLNVFRYVEAFKGSADDTTSPDAMLYFALIAHWLCYFNSAVNPVIYNFMSVKFRREFANACSCCTAVVRICAPGRRHVRRPYDSTYSYRYTNTMSETEQITLNTVNTNYLEPCEELDE